MKKFNILLFLLVVLLIPTVKVSAGSTYSSVDECIADAKRVSQGIYNQSGYTTKTLRSCYYNVCNTSTMTYVDIKQQVWGNSGRCANGNIDPKKTTTRSFTRTGGCSGQMNKVFFYIDDTYDCNYTSSGARYTTTTTTTTTTTKATTRATTRATTKATTKAPVTQAPVTQAPVTQAPTTESTTTQSTTTTTTIKTTSDASIKKIVINDSLDLKYKAGTDEYGIKVPYSLDKFDIKVTTGDKTAKVDIAGTSDISSEGGTITITVTSSDGTNQTVVKINVTRYTEEEGDCTASMIFVQDYDLGFSSNTQQYTIELKNNEKGLDIEVTPNQTDANYVINGNEKLKNGSKVQILIDAVDGTQCSYQITVKKKNNLWIYFILIIAIGIGLFFGIRKIMEYVTAGHGRYKYE